MFIASQLDWKELGLKVRQETRYPETETSRLTLTCEKPVQLTLNVRQPYWAASGIEIAVNGQKTNTVKSAKLLRELVTTLAVRRHHRLAHAYERSN